MGCRYVRKLRNLLRRVELLESGEPKYRDGGSKTISELDSSLLTKEHESELYNITDSGVTTSNFIEGADIPINAGDNVTVVEFVDDYDNVSYKFDLLSVHSDTSEFVRKSLTQGLIKNDGTIDTNDYLTQHQYLEELEVYDVTANNDNAKFASLSALLSGANLNTLIPTAVRKGGMSIKFVQNSDNKYVQYMCKTSTWSNTLTDWEKVNNVSVSQNTNTGGRQLHIDSTKSGNIDDFFNVNSYNNKGDAYNNIATARDAVPSNLRALGMTITYLLSDGWHTEQFMSNSLSDWSNGALWRVFTDEFKNSLFQNNILHDSTFELLGLYNRNGTYSLSNDKLVLLNSNAWNYVVVPVKHLSRLITFAGAASGATTQVPAILYLTSSEPNDSNLILGSEQYGTTATKTYSIMKFEGELQIPSNAKYAIINMYVAYIDNTCILEYTGDITSNISDIRKDLMDIELQFESFNIKLNGGTNKIRNLNLLDGVYYLNNNVLTYLESANWHTTIIPVNYLESVVTFAGVPTSTYKIPAILYLTDSEPIQANFISGSQQYGSIDTDKPEIKKFDSELVISNNAKYAIINVFKAYMDDTCAVEYESEIKNLNDRVDALEENKRIFIVKKSPSTGEYETIAAALSEANNGDTIKIYDGIYQESHLQIKKDMKLIGIGDVEIRGYQAASSSVSSIFNYSTLECYNGVVLKNLKITCKNLRYPIHADFSDGNACWDVENCTFIHYGNNEAYEYQVSLGASGNPNGIFNVCSAWGGGTRGGDYVKCFNCTFISTGRAFSTHNNTGDTFTRFGASHVVLDSCVMQSAAKDRDNSTFDFPAPLFIQNLDCPVDDCDVVVKNCTLNGYIVFQNTSGDGWSNMLKLFGCDENKIAFSSYGSGFASFVDCDQIATYESHYTKYPITDNINSFINRGSNIIPIGKAVKKDILGGISLYDDISEDVFGVALEEIPVGGIGRVCYKGYLSRIYLSGIRTTDISDNDAIYVDSNGDFSKSGSKIAFYATDCQNVHISD